MIESLKAILRGFCVYLLLLLLLTVSASLIVYISPISENVYPLLALILELVCLLAGGFISGRAGREKGLLKGICLAVLVLIFLWSIGTADHGILRPRSLCFLAAGGLGGILGVK